MYPHAWQVRPIACAFILWCLTACTTWRVETGVTVKELVSTEQPEVVRITRANGWYMVIHEPRIVAGDTLAGLFYRKPYSIAASDVTEIATRKVSSSKTIGLAVGISTIFAALVVYPLVHCGKNECIDSL
jgi:hypothetical protein